MCARTSAGVGPLEGSSGLVPATRRELRALRRLGVVAGAGQAARGALGQADRDRLRLLRFGLHIGLDAAELVALARLYDARAQDPGRLRDLLLLLARYQRFLLYRRTMH